MPQVKNRIASNPAIASELLSYLYGERSQEEFWILCLDTKNRILMSKMLFRGGQTQCGIDSLIVLRTAITCERCTSIIISHNHPSGELSASPQDIMLTKKLSKACEAVGLSLRDHIIIGTAEDSPIGKYAPFNSLRDVIPECFS